MVPHRGGLYKKSRADVAVAYVGQGATRLLPLRAGSKLVVDASEAAVRSGQTDPRELLKYLRDGVELFSKPRLHAKVFAFSNVAFVGSNNVSNHSANALVEAAVGLTTAIGVAQARHFVLDAAKSPMGEEFLKKLVKIYPPSSISGKNCRLHQRSSSTKPETIAEASPLRLVKLASTDWDAADMAADAAGRKAAKKLKKHRTFKLESFSYNGWSHRDLDEEILQAVRESNGEVLLSSRQGPCGAEGQEQGLLHSRAGGATEIQAEALCGSETTPQSHREAPRSRRAPGSEARGVAERTLGVNAALGTAARLEKTALDNGLDRNWDGYGWRPKGPQSKSFGRRLSVFPRV